MSEHKKSGLKRKQKLRRQTRVLVASPPSGESERLISGLVDAQYEVVRAEAIDELCTLAAGNQPDIVVLGPDGCNMVGRVSGVAAIVPLAAIVVLFDEPDEAELLAILHGGALGYLPMTISPERLRASLESVLVGEPALPRSMSATLVRQLRSPGCIILPSGDNQGFELSAREWDVICMLQQGQTTNEIAERLYVSSATVRSHISAIMRKLDVPDRDTALAAVFFTDAVG